MKTPPYARAHRPVRHLRRALPPSGHTVGVILCLSLWVMHMPVAHAAHRPGRAHVAPSAKADMNNAPNAAPVAKRNVLRRNGVGPLTKQSPVDVKVLAPLFAGCELAATLFSVKGKPVERTIGVTCHKIPVYTLHSEMDLRTLAFVDVHLADGVTQDHVGRGDRLTRLFALGHVDCDAGVDPKKRRIACIVVGQSAFAYLTTDTGHGQAGILPEPRALKKLKIDGLVWRASMI